MKKGVSLSLNMVILLILGIIVLVLAVFMLGDSVFKFGESQKCKSCMAESQCNAERGIVIPQECPEGQVCCKSKFLGDDNGP